MKMIRYVAAALVALFSLQTSAAVFLKALGEGEVERATQDGTSWATAYTDAKEALIAALASEDGTLYVAAGVYPLRDNTQIGIRTLKIYGGFAGNEEGENLETLVQRDTEANQSIFSGDKNGDDCYIHYELSTNTTPPEVNSTKMVDKPIVSNGRFNPPPDYTGEYDIYGPDNTGDNHSSGLFNFNNSNGATFVLDGIYLIGYRSNLFSVSGSSTSVTINDCRFYATSNTGDLGVFKVYNLQSFTLSNSHFAYGVGNNNGGLIFSTQGTITNCQFKSIYLTGGYRGGIIHLSSGRYPAVIADSTFERIGHYGNAEPAHGGPAVCIGAENSGSQPLIRRCEFTYCWNLRTTSSFGCTPIVGTTGGPWYIENSRFEHNFISCSMKSGYSYFLVGQHAGRVGGAFFRNTIFADNVIAAHAVEGDGNYALGIAGSYCGDANTYGGAGKHVFVNCLFDRNFAEDRTGNERIGVAPVLAEGILASARTYGTICAAANCTFISATSANPSVALFGSKHNWPVNVVNCLFLSDADIANPFYSPVVPTDTIGLRAYSCTAQNCFTVPRHVVAEGWQTDWVPLEEKKVKGSFPVVKVLTPGLRDSADLAVTDYYVKDKNVQYRFKPYGSDAWQTLHAYSSVEQTKPEALVADAGGDPRPVGEVTRGCVQSLTPEGELGKAVILRREPFGGGDLDAPSAQNVGTLVQPVVRAAPIEGATFQGWYNAAGDLVELNQEIDLSEERFANGAILTAKFSTKPVTVTFDLGDGGTFVDNNDSTISYPLREGDVFPKLPPYVESDEWLVLGWDHTFPTYVPSEDLTIKAKLLTKDSRVFYIVPAGAVPAGSDRTGTSWANATDDIAAAARDANRYRGELWFKEGTYKLSAPIYLYSNVAFIGGFKGDETERNQADPTNHVTLLTGDLNGENYWLPQGSDPGSGNRTLVFNYEERTLNVPQPASDVQTPVWRVKYTSNAANAFRDSATIGCATNALISGMTIACFSESAINVTFIKSQTLVENCRFVGNSWNANNAGVVCVKGSLQMRHCDFRYNQGGVDFKDANDNRLSVVDDSTFYCNEICKSRVFRYWPNNANQSSLTTSNCRFENNVYTAGDTSTCSIEFSGRGCTISNWVVRNTRNCPLPNANANNANGHISLSGNHTFVRCRFEDNLLDYSNLSLGLSGQSAVFHQGGGNVLCQDCFFARNTVKSKNANHWDRPVVTSVAALHSGSMTFINCTLLDNYADAMESTTAAAATVGDRNEHKECGLAFVHCTLANNTAKGGIAHADLLIHPNSENKNTTRHGIGILNSILHNSKDPSYKPLRLHASTPPTILYSALSNINKEDFNTTADGALWEDVIDNTTGIAARTSVSPDGVEALGIKSISPLTHGSGTIVISGNRPYLWNAEPKDASKPYLSLVEPTYYRTPSEVGGPADATQPAPLPDAFGAPRIIGKLAVGALNAVSRGLTIRFR